MKRILILVGLLVAPPAFAQSRVYTNADLGKRLTNDARLDPATAAAILAPYRYQAPTPKSYGGSIYVLRSSASAGPYGEFKPFDPPRRLDGTSYTDPPWMQSVYVGRYSVRPFNTRTTTSTSTTTKSR